jgi:hypothetical protein
MNHREPPHLPAGARRALHCLSLLLLPALAPDGVQALPRTRPPGSGRELQTADPIPYLPMLGAPPLRFQDATPPPDLVMRPAAAAPPTPALTLAETSVALANAAAARSAAVVAETPDASSAPETPEPTAAVTEPAAAPPPAPVKTPPPILPDSLRPAVRPEDFLPYFQIPGAARQPADVTVLLPGVPTAPAPAPLPPGSATYRQTPR